VFYIDELQKLRRRKKGINSLGTKENRISEQNASTGNLPIPESVSTINSTLARFMIEELCLADSGKLHDSIATQLLINVFRYQLQSGENVNKY